MPGPGLDVTSLVVVQPVLHEGDLGFLCGDDALGQSADLGTQGVVPHHAGRLDRAEDKAGGKGEGVRGMGTSGAGNPPGRAGA